MTGFEHWWALVWRKEGKTPARYEYDIALELIDHDTLCDAARRRTAAYLRDGTPADKQIMPKNWLKDQRWTDELPDVAAAPTADALAIKRCELRLRGILRDFNPGDARIALRLGAITEDEARRLGL